MAIAKSYLKRRLVLTRPKGVRAPFELNLLPDDAVHFALDPSVGITADGSSLISDWQSSVGEGVFSTSTTAEKPTLVTTSDGKQAVRGNGVSGGSILRSTNIAALEKRVTLLVADRPNADQNGTAVAKDIWRSKRLSDGRTTAVHMLRVVNDASQNIIYLRGYGNANGQPFTGFSKGSRGIFTADHASAIARGSLNTGSFSNGATSSTTGTIEAIFGSDDNAANRAAIDLLYLLAVDAAKMPGGIEQLAWVYLLEGFVAWKCGAQSLLRSDHPYKSRAPKATDFTGNNRLFQVWGDSLAAGMGGQLSTAIDATALGLTARNGGVGGEQSWQTWYRLINGFDNGGAWGAPLTTGLTTTEQAAKIVVIGDILANDQSNEYPTGVISDTTPESGATSGGTPDPFVGTTWGNLYDMVYQTELRQGVTPGQGLGRIILWPFWTGNGESGVTANVTAVRAMKAALAASPIYGNYALDMEFELNKLAAPGQPYEDAEAYAAGLIPPALRVGYPSVSDSTHLNTTGYLEAANIVAAFAEAKGWSL